MSRILKITVEGSKFYSDPMEITFSNKLNCIMGGRGTGKTTLLWLIASGLEPYIEEDKDIYALLNSNLGGGRIRLTLENLDGETFEIEKVLGENPIVYSADRTVVDFDRFKEGVAVDFYKSAQIEEIGTNPEDRLNLIDKHLGRPIRECRKLESVVLSQLNQNKSVISDLLIQRRELTQKLDPLEDVEKELKEYEKLRPEGSDEESKEFTLQNENQKNREFESQFRDESMQGLNTLQFKMDHLLSDVSGYISSIEKFETKLNKEIIDQIKKAILPSLHGVQESIQKSKAGVQDAVSKANQKASELVQLHKDQESEFTQLKQKFEKNREYFQKLNQLTKRVTAKAVSKKELDSTMEKLETAVDQRKILLESLKGIHRKIFETRLKKVEEINRELSGDVKITLKEGGIVKEYERLLKDSLKGKGFNYNDICGKIIENVKPTDFSLMVLKEDAKTLGALTNTPKEKVKLVVDALLQSQDIFNIECVYCPDLPTFFLKVDRKDDAENQEKENYRQTESLSTGQRCTAILPIIFAASSNPLVIDQPEDNLDNKYIADSIHKIIKKKKDFRQLIFVTHNPNIPVLSDAEFNLFLDYKGKKSKVDSAGGIEDVKTNILTLLEGGEDAFKRRRDIYGY